MYTSKVHMISCSFSNSLISSSAQVGPNSKIGKSIFSYFSYIISLVNLGIYSKTSNRESDSNSDKDQASGRSTDMSYILEEKNEEHSPLTSKNPPLDLIEGSAFVTPKLKDFFESCLPNTAKGCKWNLLYSTMKHGISLRTLNHKSSQLSSPGLLIVGDMEGAIFGGLIDCPLKPTTKPKYQGTNQTFVFTTMYGQPRIFRPTGVNRYFYLCSNNLLALGGGAGFALYLDEDLLTGTSGPSTTFGNPCLAHSSEFELKNVELWGFSFGL